LRGQTRFGVRRASAACLLALAVFLGVAAAAPGAVLDAAAAAQVRGIYRFSSTDWRSIAGDGFNWVTDGGTNTNNYPGQRAAGLHGMVWVDAYDNSRCTQTMSDAQIRAVVTTNVGGGNSGAVYQVGDEPTTNGCAAASTYAHITSVIHGADRSARTWVADDQFNDPSISHWPAGLPMKGSVDILAFDIYPCQAGPCRLDMIDGAVQRIHSVGLQGWEFILQDFGPCQSWRAPTAAEVLQQFQHWQQAGAIGYWVYTYDADNTPCPGNVGGAAVLKQINAMNLGPAAATPPRASTAPKASPKASPPATNNPAQTPSAGASASGAPASGSPSAIGSPQLVADDFGSTVLPLILIGAGVLAGLAGLGLNYLRRRPGP